MNDLVIVLTPLLVLLIVAVFGFTGCSSFGSAEPAPGVVAGPGLIGVTPPPPVTPPTYEQIVTNTPGYAAHWRLNETGGNVANVHGALNPTANGLYVTGVPAGSGLKLGEPGALSHQDKTDFAPEFNGTAAYVEVPFHAPLNPGNKVAGFSVELWVKPNPAVGQDTQVLISSHHIDATGKQQGYEIALIRKSNEPHQQLRARVFSSAATPSEVTVQPIQGNPDDWRYILLTYQGSGAASLTLYVKLAKTLNPFQGGPASALYDNVSAPTTLRFGASHRAGQSAGNFFAGRIDEVAFYNGVLAQIDIDKHFNMF